MASVASCTHPRASSPECQDLSLHLHEHAAIPLFRTGAQVVRRAASRSGHDACPGVDVSTVTARARTKLSLLLAAGRTARSEEHTSELPSLMRNSYAVFCLKKKKKQ